MPYPQTTVKNVEQYYNGLTRRNVGTTPFTSKLANLKPCNRFLDLPAIFKPARRAISVILLVQIIPGVRAEDSGDEFSNNLFTDLAPLLALFGEQVVKQYLSQSTQFLEHVIFACGPLGILTAVTSAIRVAGSRSLMAIIGRAREPRAQAEIELMSSTSSEVCELWNGLGIVRVNGKPDVIELIYDPTYTYNGGPYYRGINVLDEMKKVPRAKTGIIPTRLLALFKTTISSHSRLPTSSIDNSAPSISLNIVGHHVSQQELRYISSIGIVLQVGILAFEGLITYHLRWQKGDQHVAKYAYPLTAIGTLAISVGMFICAYVIEAKTEENEYDICRNGNKLQMLWIQRAQSVSDQEFGPWAIYAARNQQRIITSRSLPDNSDQLARVTTIGVISTTIGFILQFIGLRGMHFSASLGNLIVAAVMTVLRTFLRRGLTIIPDNSSIPSENSYSVCELCKGHELDSVAKDMVACTQWTVITHILPAHDDGLRDDKNKVMQVWMARMKLAELSGPQWEGELQATVDNITETIQAIANYLWSPIGGLVASGPAERLTNLDWYTIVGARGTTWSQTKRVYMSLSRREAGPWLANRSEIAATLSLWMSEKKSQRGANNLWLLGADGGDGDMGRILADWWISRENKRVEVDLLTGYSNVLDCVFATNVDASDISAEFPETTIRTRPALSPQTSRLEMCAQYLLSVFVSFAVYHIDRITASTDIKVVDDERSLTITSESIHRLAEKVQRSGLATTEDAYRIVVPALFRAHKLPNFASEILGKVAAVKDRSSRGRAGNTSTVKDLEEFYRLVQSACTDEANSLIRYDQWREAGDIFRDLEDTFSKLLGPTHHRTMSVRGTVDALCKKLISVGHKPVNPNDRSIHAPMDINKLSLHEAISSGCVPELYNAVGIKDSELTLPDDTGRTPLQLAATLGKPYIVMLLLFLGAPPNTTDLKMQRTALHSAVSNNDDNLIQDRIQVAELLLKNGVHIDAKDRDGSTALILAAEGGYKGLTELLTENGADINAQNGHGDSAITLSAKGGHEEVVAYLVEKNVDVNTANGDGDTALIMAARIGNQKIAKKLIEGGASMDIALAAEQGYEVVLNLLIGGGINGNHPRGNLDTAILLAAQRGHAKIVILLLQNGAGVDARDKDSNTPLILAAERGHQDVVEVLLNYNADVDALGEDGRTALLALGGQHEKIIELLLKKAADPNARDTSQSTALHWAALAGDERAVKLLLDHGADPHSKSDDLSTPLHSAANSGVEGVVRLLWERNPNLNARDNNGDTALLVATQGRHFDVVKFLAERGADVNISNNVNWTAIQWAMFHQDEAMKAMLLDHGAVME